MSALVVNCSKGTVVVDIAEEVTASVSACP
jgi:hypothetical protein